MVNKTTSIRDTEPAISKYLNQKGCELGIPVSGNFELTARCNFNCKMCYVHLQDHLQELKQKELTADQWLSIASDAKDQGLLFLLLTGGEPFLRNDFERIYRELIKMGIVVSINTNASLYNDDLRKLFREYPPMRINVSLYGGSEETYQNLCGNASFEKVLKNIANMKEDKLQIRLNISLTPYNVGDMNKIYDITNQLNLHAKMTSYMFPPVRVTGKSGNNAGRFEADEAGKIMAQWARMRDTKETLQLKAKQIKQIQNSKINFAPSNEGEKILCRAGRSSFWITWDGKMQPCGTMDIEPSYPLKDGFVKAWEEVRERADQIRLPKECSACKWRQFCGVCAANCKCETEAFDKKPEYLCRMTESRCQTILNIVED